MYNDHLTPASSPLGKRLPRADERPKEPIAEHVGGSVYRVGDRYETRDHVPGSAPSVATNSDKAMQERDSTVSTGWITNPNSIRTGLDESGWHLLAGVLISEG